MVITTFKQNSRPVQRDQQSAVVQHGANTGQLTYLLEQTRFMQWMLNSLIIGVCVVVITLIVAGQRVMRWRACDCPGPSTSAS